MTWDDGYGDTLTAYESWLHYRADQMGPARKQVRPNAEDHDDLVQHGRVAMWKALDTFDPERGALPAWLTLKATGAMRDALRPAPTKHGQERSLDGLLESGEVSDAVDTPDALIDHPDMLEGLMRAYHSGQVQQALDCLTPRQREYVHLRFWKGAQKPQLVEHFGYDPRGLWSSPKNGAKMKLRGALAHLLADA